MAKTPKSDKSPGKVLQMEAESSAVAVEEPPEPAEETQEPQEPAASTKPAQEDPERRRKTAKSFFERLRSIPTAEWGTRAFVYVYCLEPICDLKMGGEKKYLVKLKQPIFDEDPIMVDYGSGKYRLQLVYRKPAADKADQVDNVEIEIYNPKYPPKIPASVWMQDPRNARWLALLPSKEEQAAANKGSDVLDTLKTLNQIQKDVREEMKPATQPAGNDVDRFTAMVGAMKAIMPQASPTTDNTMLTTVVTLLQTQIAASNAEAQQLRAQVFELIKDRKTEQPAKDSLETMLDKAPQLIEKLKGLMDLGGNKLTEVVHGKQRKWYEELALQAIPPIAQSLAPAAGYLIQNLLIPKPNGNPAPQQQVIQQPAAQIGAPAAPQPPQVVEGAMTPQTRFTMFLQQNSGPALKYARGFIAGEEGADGASFAYWIYDGHGDGPLKDARLMGVDGILGIFKAAPIWPAMAMHEPKLREFIQAFIDWNPPDDEDDDDNDGSQVPVGVTASTEEEIHG